MHSFKATDIKVEQGRNYGFKVYYASSLDLSLGYSYIIK